MVQLSNGGAHACGISAKGVLQCFGTGNRGALGNGKNEDKAGISTIPGDWAYVSAGVKLNTCAIKKDGSLWCWGDNYYNMVNPSYSSVVTKPFKIAGKWKSVSVGSHYVLAIDTTGKAYGWGLNELFDFETITAGSLGTGRPLCYNFQSGSFCDDAGQDYEGIEKYPVPVAGGRKWASISASEVLSCGVEAGTNKGYCWGFANEDRYSLGSPQTNAPKLIDASKWVVLKVGGDIRCGIKTDGSLWCWGRAPSECSSRLDNKCPLGDGSVRNSPVPVKVINVNSWIPAR